MNQFDDEANDTHNHKADADSLRDFDEFALIRLGTPVNKRSAILEELARDIGDLFQLVRHCCAGVLLLSKVLRLEG